MNAAQTARAERLFLWAAVLCLLRVLPDWFFIDKAVFDLVPLIILSYAGPEVARHRGLAITCFVWTSFHVIGGLTVLVLLVVSPATVFGHVRVSTFGVVGYFIWNALYSAYMVLTALAMSRVIGRARSTGGAPVPAQ